MGIPKLSIGRNLGQTNSRRDDSSTKSTISYVSEIMRKKKKIFGINGSTLNFKTDASYIKGQNHNIRSLTLAPSTFLSKVEKY
jgi:hypothetical protein